MLIAISSLLLLTGTVNAQNKSLQADTTTIIKQSAKYRVSFQPAQLLVQEVSLSVERLRSKSSLGILLAYRFNGELSYGYPEWELLGDPTYTEQEYQAITLGITTKSFFSSRKTWYWEGQLFYRHWWDKDYKEYQDVYNTKTYIKSTSNDFVESIGVKALLGYTAHLSKRGRVRPILTFHTGVGLRGNFYHDFFQTISDDVVVKEYKMHEEKILPSLHLGIGFGFEIFARRMQYQ